MALYLRHAASILLVEGERHGAVGRGTLQALVVCGRQGVQLLGRGRRGSHLVGEASICLLLLVEADSVPCIVLCVEAMRLNVCLDRLGPLKLSTLLFALEAARSVLVTSSASCIYVLVVEGVQSSSETSWLVEGHLTARLLRLLL